MVEHNTYKFKIDEEFRHFIPPLSSGERKQLEESIISDGCREPICVWNQTILDGHNRYEICTRLQIPFKISYVFLKSREEAVAWICANQLGRKNITNEARRYLIGKRYRMEKIIGAHNAAGTNQFVRKDVGNKKYTEPLFDESAIMTRERLGKEYQLSPATIAKYGDYSQSLDILSKNEPNLLPKILKGKIKISQENIVGLSKLIPSERRRICMELLEEGVGCSYKRYIVKNNNTPKMPDFPPIQASSVKDMPAYDPDAEVLSLAFTIPSWVSSIARTRSAANFSIASASARHMLEEELIGLRSIVDKILLAVKEDNSW